MEHHKIGEVFTNPNAIPGNIAHIVLLTTPEETSYPSVASNAADHLIYIAVCGVLDHELPSWGTLEPCAFVAGSKQQAETLLPKAQQCPTCFSDLDTEADEDNENNSCNNFHYPPEDYYSD